MLSISQFLMSHEAKGWKKFMLFPHGVSVSDVGLGALCKLYHLVLITNMSGGCYPHFIVEKWGS